MRNHQKEKQDFHKNKIHQVFKNLGGESLGDLDKLKNFEGLLDQNLKNIFGIIPKSKILMNQISEINSSASDIFDQVSCYRIELGMCLKQMLASYSIIFIQLFKTINFIYNSKT